MSRSSKTNHVMSLVGRERKTDAKPVQRAFPHKPADTEFEPEIKNPALREMIANQAAYTEFSEQENQYEEKEPSAEEAEKKPEDEAAAVDKEDLPPKGSRLTAIIPELINEELETIVNRFKLPPTDGNLWKLTRAALESIRPEFSHNPKEYAEKSDRLRQSVILEMTKAAIKLLSKEKSSD